MKQKSNIYVNVDLRVTKFFKYAGHTPSAALSKILKILDKWFIMDINRLVSTEFCRFIPVKLVIVCFEIKHLFKIRNPTKN